MVTVALTVLTLAFAGVSWVMFHRARAGDALLRSVDMVFGQLRALYISGATGLIGGVLGFAAAVFTANSWPLVFAVPSMLAAFSAVYLSFAIRHQEPEYLQYQIDRLRQCVQPQKWWKWPKE
jgi:hypothetical protein